MTAPDHDAYRSKTGLMTDRDGVLTIRLIPLRGLQIAAFGCFSLIGFALIAVFVASVVAPNPGVTPAWAWLGVGVVWTGLCLLGIGTNSFVEIDGNTSELRRVISRFGVREVQVAHASHVVRVGVVAWRRSINSPYRYKVRLETREEIPILQMRRVWPLHQSTDVDVANQDGRRIAERLGVPFEPGRVPGSCDPGA